MSHAQRRDHALKLFPSQIVAEPPASLARSHRDFECGLDFRVALSLVLCKPHNPCRSSDTRRVELIWGNLNVKGHNTSAADRVRVGSAPTGSLSLSLGLSLGLPVSCHLSRHWHWRRARKPTAHNRARPPQHAVPIQSSRSTDKCRRKCAIHLSSEDKRNRRHARGLPEAASPSRLSMPQAARIEATGTETATIYRDETAFTAPAATAAAAAAATAKTCGCGCVVVVLWSHLTREADKPQSAC